jgi:hypothetical protein
MFYFMFIIHNYLPQAPEYSFANFRLFWQIFEDIRKLKVHHRFQQHRKQKVSSYFAYTVHCWKKVRLIDCFFN